VFEAIAPWLILGATLVILLQQVGLRFGVRPASAVRASPPASGSAARAAARTAHAGRRLALIFFPVPVGIYGGYFGGAMGSSCSPTVLVGEMEIHQMNAIKTSSRAWSTASRRSTSWRAAGRRARGRADDRVRSRAASRAAHRPPHSAARRTLGGDRHRPWPGGDLRTSWIGKPLKTCKILNDVEAGRHEIIFAVDVARAGVTITA